jgi:chloramphenicol O-acetyltransferase type A
MKSEPLFSWRTNELRKIDIDQWDRKQQFLFFKNLDVPQYQITTTIDVTHFRQYAKDHKQSFYLSFIHCLLKVLNQMDCFKYRFIENDVVLFDQIHPSFTDQITGSQQCELPTTL